MRRMGMSITVAVLAAAVGLAGSAQAEDKAEGLKHQGKAELKSAGPLAFGPSGVLFVGDSQGAAVFALGVDAKAGPALKEDFKLEGVDAKIAALLGTKAEDLMINDMAIQPGSGVAYLSVSRGKGPDALPVILRVDGDKKITEVSLDKIAYDKLTLSNAPSESAKDGKGRSLRQEAITDLAFVEGRLFIAGLSNEEFASKLRAIEFPFASTDLATSIEIYHGAHGQFETRAPVRTFVPFVINDQPHLLAAYTCTPLVTIPVAELKAGSKVQGRTVAELGNHNRPLDIITYRRDGHTFLLVANSARGVMKVATDKIASVDPIKAKVNDTAGLGYETIENLKGVEQLDKLDDTHAVLLVRNGGAVSLESLQLP